MSHDAHANWKRKIRAQRRRERRLSFQHRGYDSIFVEVMQKAQGIMSMFNKVIRKQNNLIIDAFVPISKLINDEFERRYKEAGEPLGPGHDNMCEFFRRQIAEETRQETLREYALAGLTPPPEALR